MAGTLLACVAVPCALRSGVAHVCLDDAVGGRALLIQRSGWRIQGEGVQRRAAMGGLAVTRALLMLTHNTALLFRQR